MVRYTTDLMDMNLSNLQETVKESGAWCAAIHGVTKSRTRARAICLMVRLSSVVFGVLSADKKQVERSVLQALDLAVKKR